jgi:hypothetical protein
MSVVSKLDFGRISQLRPATLSALNESCSDAFFGFSLQRCFPELVSICDEVVCRRIYKAFGSCW